MVKFYRKIQKLQNNQYYNNKMKKQKKKNNNNWKKIKEKIILDLDM